MSRIVAVEYLSVDGRMEMRDPEGKEEELGGWTAPYWNDELEKIQYDQLFRSDALLLGRVTYEGFAASWPSQTDEQGFADRMNHLPKYVGIEDPARAPRVERNAAARKSGRRSAKAEAATWTGHPDLWQRRASEYAVG
jgi:dihydrofolate reductase